MITQLTTNDPWDRFVALGYADRLVPIVPPSAEPRPTITGKDLVAFYANRGKMPGLRGSDGYWFPIKWKQAQATPDTIEAWRRSGAGIGMRCGAHLMAIDADTLDLALAKSVKQKMDTIIGETPIRIGRFPKAAYVIRTEEIVGTSILKFRGGQIEFRGGGQFVVDGVHRDTGEPYRWPSPLTTFADLPVVSKAQLQELMDRLAEILPEAEKTDIGSEGRLIDQEMLRGTEERLRAALTAMGNGEYFTPYRRYITVCYATKATSAGEDWGRELFLWWCEQWTGGAVDLDVSANHWDRLDGDFEVGIGYLEDLAFRLTKGAFDPRRAQWFEVEPESIFPEEPEPPPDIFDVIDASEWNGVTPPEQRWIVKDLIPERQVTSLSGDGGAGKSLLALQLALDRANGEAWLSEPTMAGDTLFVTAEEDDKDLMRRLSPAIVGAGLLHIVSLWGKDAVIAYGDAKDGLLKKTALFGKLERTIGRLRPSLVVLDTRADMFGGNEISRIHARQFVGMLQEIVRVYETTVLLLEHPSVAGMASGSGYSGNTAWSNSVRARLYLERRIGEDKKEADPDVRVLSLKKSNRSRIGRDIILRYVKGRFVAQTNARAFLTDEIEARDDAVFLELLAIYETLKDPVSFSQKSPKRYAPKVFAAHPQSDGVPSSRFEAAMYRLLERKEIGVISYGPKSKEQQRLTIKSAPDSLF